MVTRNIEGTVTFDGLLEGRIPAESAHDIEPKLREWVTFARQGGVKFTLEIDGATFSLLADTQPVPVTAFGGEDPATAVKQLLDQLMNVFAPPHRTGVFSTLRSSEFRPGKQVQTIYAVVPPGRIEIQERQVDAETHPPDEPLSTKERVKLGVTGVLIAVLIVAVSSLFIDYGGMLSQFRNTIAPIDTQKIVVDTGAYESLFTVEEVRTDTVQRRLCLMLTLKPVEDFPKTDAALDSRWQAAKSLHDKLAIEAVARGYLRVEQYNDEGKLIAAADLPLHGLAEAEQVEVPIPITRKTRPAVVKFRY